MAPSRFFIEINGRNSVLSFGEQGRKRDSLETWFQMLRTDEHQYPRVATILDQMVQAIAASHYESAVLAKRAAGIDVPSTRAWKHGSKLRHR